MIHFRRRRNRKKRERAVETVQDVKWYNLGEGGEGRRERGGGENVKYVKW